MITPKKEQKEEVLTKEFFVSHLNSRFGEFRAEMRNEMDDFKTEIRGEIISFKSEVQYQFKTLTEMVAQNTVDITEIKEDIGCLKSDVRDIKYDMSDIQSTLSRHDRRITHLEKVVA